jgi:NADH pyrophosphatase NudC (nudix superfamily)
VRREVYKEVGAFPASLMLGVRAVTRSDELPIDPEDLVDAGWYTHAQLIESGPGSDSAAEPGLDRPTPDRGLAVRGPRLSFGCGSGAQR